MPIKRAYPLVATALLAGAFALIARPYLTRAPPLRALLALWIGQNVLRSARRDGPDLIVLDVGLPEMDGLEVCRRLRAESEVPIRFLTARDDEIDRIVRLELGRMTM